MLIQIINGAATASRRTEDSVPVPLAAAKEQPRKIELPQIGNHTAAEQPAVQPSATPTPAQIKAAVDSMNKAMKQINSSLEFSIDHDTKKTVIKVVESGTNIVIQQYPSEEILAIARVIDQQMQQQGILLNQKA